MKNRCYQVDNVEIDAQNLRVTVASEIRPLEPKSFRLLLFLVENRGRVLSKDEIMPAVWPDAFVSDNSLARAIAQVRRALDDDPKAPKYIETVPTGGYRFIGDCQEIAADEPTTPVPDGETTGGKAVAEGADTPRANSKPWVPVQPRLVAASAATVILVLAGWHFLSAPAADVPQMRVAIDTPATNDPRSFVLSPDRRQLAYVATSDGQSRLWMRQLASTKAQPLAVTEGGV